MLLPLSHIPLIGLPVWPTFGLGVIVLVQAAVMLFVWRTRRDPTPIVILFAAMTLGAAIGSQFLFSIMGGVAGAILGVICIRRLLPRTFPAEAFAVSYLFVMIAIGRIGCFLSGCCFGSPIELPWAATYGTGSAALLLHRAMGLVPNHADCTLRVHPVQLYETVFLALSVLLITVLHRRFKDQTAVPFAAFGAYFLFRGLIESIRDYSNVYWGIVHWGPLTAFQWVMFGTAGIFFLIPVLRCTLFISGESPATEKPLSPGLVQVFTAALLLVSPVLYWRVPFGLGVALLIATASVSMICLVKTGLCSVPRPVFRPLLWCGVLLLCIVPYAWRVCADDRDTLASDSSRPAGIYRVDAQEGKVVRIGTTADSDDTIAERLEQGLPESDSSGVDPFRRYWSLAVLGGSSYGRAAWENEVTGSCGGSSYLYQYQMQDVRAMIGFEETFVSSPTFSLVLGQRIHLARTFGNVRKSEFGSYRDSIQYKKDDMLGVMGSLYYVAQWQKVSIGGGFSIGSDTVYSPGAFLENLQPLFVLKAGDPSVITVSVDYNTPRIAMPYQKTFSLRLGRLVGPVGISAGFAMNPFNAAPGLVGGVTHFLPSGILYSLNGGYSTHEQWYLAFGLRGEIGKNSGYNAQALFTAW